MESVSIVIVNWNTGKLLGHCLDSLRILPERSGIRHIIIVDNASADSSIEQARKIADMAGCIILEQSENLGFAKANNIGIAYVQQHGGHDDHILLLNPDTIVHMHAIENMVNALEHNIPVGIVGPKLLEKNGDIQPSVRAFPTLRIFFLLFVKLHRLFSATRAWQHYMMTGFTYDQEQQVDQVMGAAFLIRNTLLKKIGTLDESFWIWFEEVDYCKRAQMAGFAVLYTPEASVTHYKGVSFNQLVGLRKTQPLLHSSLIYAKKHSGVGAYAILLILYPFGILIALVASLAHMHQKTTNAQNL